MLSNRLILLVCKCQRALNQVKYEVELILLNYCRSCVIGFLRYKCISNITVCAVDGFSATYTLFHISFYLFKLPHGTIQPDVVEAVLTQDLF